MQSPVVSVVGGISGISVNLGRLLAAARWICQGGRST